MKLFFVAFFALLLLANGFAVYCDQTTDPAYDSALCTCRVNTGDLSQTWQELPDTIVDSEWFNMYCAGNGMLQQQRALLQIVKPSCDKRVETRETQQVYVDFCLSCPAPVSTGEWKINRCVGSLTLWQKDILAYYYLPSVQECEQGKWIELKLEDDNVCRNNIVVNPFSLPDISAPLAPSAITPTAIVLSFGAVAAICLWIVILVVWWRQRK